MCTHQDVVRLDVGVEDVASLEELQGQEELLAVGAHRLDVETHVLAVLLQHLPQVHAAAGDHMSVTRHELKAPGERKRAQWHSAVCFPSGGAVVEL